MDLIKKIDEMKIKDWYPHNRMPKGDESRRNDAKGEKWGDTWRKGYHAGITHVHHFYTKRTILILSKVYKKIIFVHFLNHFF